MEPLEKRIAIYKRRDGVVLSRRCSARKPPRVLSPPGVPGKPPRLRIDAPFIQHVAMTLVEKWFDDGGDQPAKAALHRNQEVFKAKHDQADDLRAKLSM